MPPLNEAVPASFVALTIAAIFLFIAAGIVAVKLAKRRKERV